MSRQVCLESQRKKPRCDLACMGFNSEGEVYFEVGEFCKCGSEFKKLGLLEVKK